MKISDFKIATRLYLSFGFIAALLLTLITVALVSSSRLADANAMNVHTYRVLEETQGMLEALINIETGQRGHALTGADASLEPLRGGQQAFRQHLDGARKLTADNPAQQQRLAALERAQQAWYAEAIEPALALRAKVTGGSAAIDDVLALEKEGRGKRGMDAMRAALAEIGGTERTLLAERTAAAEASQSATFHTLVAGGLATALCAALIAVAIARNITKPLGTAVELAERVAQGDLTSHIEATGRDEVGQLLRALKRMNDALTGIVAEVRSGADAIATSSAQIASGNIDLSSRTEEQAGALEETASSMEELTSTVQQNAAHADEARTMAANAAQVAAQGGDVVTRVVQTMGGIDESSRRIVDIIAVIDGIAFQTNILALNAAVEAARAGEQGRGFAVVAGEVRSLAQRCANAAKEIKELIDQSVSRVASGSKLVGEAGTIMGDVVASVSRVRDLIADISAASAEQRSGIEGVSEAVAQMDNVTQQNAALVEEAAAAASALQEQAARLQAKVQVFRLASAGPRERAATAAPVGRPLLA